MKLLFHCSHNNVICEKNILVLCVNVITIFDQFFHSCPDFSLLKKKGGYLEPPLVLKLYLTNVLRRKVKLEIPSNEYLCICE